MYVHWKKAASAISMKFCALDLIFTRNQMKQVLGPKNDALGVKGQYGKK
jgi:hypothetical protein